MITYKSLGEIEQIAASAKLVSSVLVELKKKLLLELVRFS